MSIQDNINTDTNDTDWGTQQATVTAIPTQMPLPTYPYNVIATTTWHQTTNNQRNRKHFITDKHDARSTSVRLVPEFWWSAQFLPIQV